MENLPGRVDDKRRGFFLVERAQPFEILTCFRQGHVVAHDIDDIDSIFDPVDDVIRDQTVTHRSRSSPTFSPPPIWTRRPNCLEKSTEQDNRRFENLSNFGEPVISPAANSSGARR